MRRREADERIAEVLDWALDGEPLTGVGARRWRGGYRPRRVELIDRACWLRAGGMTYQRIGQVLGVNPMTAAMYVSMTEPRLHFRRRG